MKLKSINNAKLEIYTLHLKMTDKLPDIQEQIKSLTGCDPEHYFLIHKEKTIEPHFDMAIYDIKPDDIFYLVS